MATNVYAAKETDLSRYGFRWCNKDCRWETGRSLSTEDCTQLAQKVAAKVEVVKSGNVLLTVNPEDDVDFVLMEE